MAAEDVAPRLRRARADRRSDDHAQAIAHLALSPPSGCDRCVPDAGHPICNQNDVRTCHDTPDVGYDTVDPATNTKVHHPGFVDAARLAMPDIDAVTMATPAPDQRATVMYTVPQTWPAGDYVAWVEVNTEGDYNGTYNDMTFPTPMSGDWDSWAMSNGYAYRGQPSVVYSVPFTLGSESDFAAKDPVGYGAVDGVLDDGAAMHVMDGTITNDPVSAPGSGADRLRMPPVKPSACMSSLASVSRTRLPSRPRGSWPRRSTTPNARTNGGTCSSSPRRAR